MDNNVETTPLKPLLSFETQRLKLAILCGCMLALDNIEEGASHSKRKRTLNQVREQYLRRVGRKIRGVTQSHRDLFTDYLGGADTVLSKLSKEGERPQHILLNLGYWCLQDLPVTKDLKDKYLKLYDLWSDANVVPAEDNSGERLYLWIQREAMKKQVLRKGIQ